MNRRITTCKNRYIKSSIILSLVLSLSFILFLTLSIGFIYKTTEKGIIEGANIEHLNELDTLHQILEGYISRLETHVIQISKVTNIKNLLLQYNDYDKSIVEGMFKSMIEYNTKSQLPTFDHMRVVDTAGNEVIRVNLSKDGKAVIVPSKEHQNKAHRYYFDEIRKMDKDSTYISKVDLNIENFKIEIPYKPAIRAAKPILGSKNEVLGYLIINMDFSSVLRELTRKVPDKGDNLYILNSNGYYLCNCDPDKIFGFMFEDKENVGFFSDYPETWESMQKSKDNIYNYDDGLMYMKRFIFSYDAKTEDKNTWYLILKLSKEALKDRNKLLNRAVLKGFVSFAPLLILIGVILGKSLSKNRFYISELEKNSTHDEMTKLLNYQGAMSEIESLIKLASRLNKTLFAIFIDINDLKKINDNQGHKYGDRLIVTMGNSIHKVIRETDAAARIGGDEYILFLFDLDEANIKIIMERIEEDFASNGKKIFGWETTFSWGSSQWMGSEDTIKGFISRADEQMYKMKKFFKG